MTKKSGNSLKYSFSNNFSSLGNMPHHGPDDMPHSWCHLFPSKLFSSFSACISSWQSWGI